MLLCIMQVDLKCTTTGCGGQYYPEHLPTLGMMSCTRTYTMIFSKFQSFIL